MSDRIRIVVVDDHPMFRAGVIQTLAADPLFEIVGQGASAKEAIHLAEQELPEMLLLDIDIPGGGLDAAEVIARTCPATKLVMLTVSESEESLAKAVKVGARAYILKGVAGRELIRILLAVRAGEVYVTPALATTILFEMSAAAQQSKDPGSSDDDLSDRETQILEHLAAGKSNREIGEVLLLSEKTVKHYMTNILQKMQVRNRVEAALKAQRAGFPKTKV